MSACHRHYRRGYGFVLLSTLLAWLGVASAAGEGPAATPDGVPGGGTTDLGDWDWEEIQEAEPPAGPSAASRSPRGATARRKRLGPRVGETAHPDFSRPPEPGHRLFAEAPEFLVVPSQKDPDMHPCDDCHEWAESDLTPRILQEPHDNFVLTHGLHGRGEFWCFTCHDLEGEGGIRTLEGLRLGFDEAYTVCAQCHAQEARDWSFGAHGKRVGNWKGERVILNCTVCHYQHRPAVTSRRPRPPRPVPAYTAQQDQRHLHRTERPWDRYERRYAREKDR